MIQNWNPDNYAANARFVSELGMPVVKLLNPQPGERILDIGCGDGFLAEKFMKLGCTVVAVDGSPQMVEGARKRGLEARMMDGQKLDFQNEFDAVFSNAAMHWMKEADAVIAGVARALKPGGRFVAEFGGKGNVASIQQSIAEALKTRGLDFAALNPWYFPESEDYRAKLEKHGFRVEEIALYKRPTILSEDTGWLKTLFVHPFLHAIPESEHEKFLREVGENLAERIYKDGVWNADYVRLRFRAIKAG